MRAAAEEGIGLHPLDSPNDSDVSCQPQSFDAAPAAPKASLLAGTLNLLNTIVGGGILALPFGFRSSGMVVGVAYQLCFGLMSWYGSWLLLASLRFRPEKSYEGLALSALGRGGWVAYNVAALLNCYGACVSYMIVVGDVLAPLSAEVGLTVGRSTVLALVVLFLVFPLSAMRDISSLRYASGTAIAIYVAFVGCLLVLWAGGPAPPTPPAAFKPEASGLMRSIPLVAFAFMCQTSLFPIYQETERPTEPRMLRLTSAAFLAAGALYTLTGVAAYAHFGEALHGDVLLNLVEVDSAGVRLVRLGFGISICLTYPCLHYAARRSLDQLLFSRGDAAGSVTPYPRLLALTVGLVGSTLGLGLVLQRVEVVFGFTGAVASTALSFVLPASIHLKVSPQPRRAVGSVALLLVGSLMGLVSLTNHTVDTFSR